MAAPRTLPDFICLGTPRSGTTWLYENLKVHPDIFLTPKEVHFFSGVGDDDYYATHGYQWYSRFFDEAKPTQLKGEVAIHYFYSDVARTRILSDVPEAKFIVMMRNPIDRIKSIYELLYGRGDFQGNFKQFLQDWRGNNQLNTGLYDRLFSKWEESFPTLEIHTVFLDDIQADRVSVYKDVCRFLGVGDQFIPETIHKKVNEPRAVRSKIVRKIYAETASYISRRNFYSLRKIIKSSKLPHLIQKINNSTGYRLHVDEQDRQLLREFYRDDIRKLEQRFNRDLSHWLL